VRPPANVPVPQTTTQVSVEGDLGALTALTEDSIVVGKIKIAADVRTNRIHVITRPVNMPFYQKADFRIRCERRIREAGYASVALHIQRRRKFCLSSCRS